jgi:hypothetical protein
MIPAQYAGGLAEGVTNRFRRDKMVGYAALTHPTRSFGKPGMSISATSVRFDEHTMWVALTDGRTLGVPLAWFPHLLRATPAQREHVEISRVGLHWEAINEDISIAGLLAGRSVT